MTPTANLNPEQEARVEIDRQLEEAGWLVQDAGENRFERRPFVPLIVIIAEVVTVYADPFDIGVAGIVAVHVVVRRIGAAHDVG